MKNKILLIILFFTLIQCGYSPIYSRYSEPNFKIIIDSLSGDKEINSIIESKIDRVSNDDSIKRFNIEVSTYFAKSILSKNRAGTISEYQLVATTNFIIDDGKKVNNYSVEEKITLPTESDVFKERNYEKKTKITFANSISEKLLLKLTNFK